jgi:Flp pilus assembly protein TadG
MLRSFAAKTRARRRGVVMALVAATLVGLMALVALCLDLGRVLLAAQLAQNVADESALAAADTGLSSQSAANTNIGYLVTAANAAASSCGGQQVTWSSGETTYYAAGATVPGYGALGSSSLAVTVVIHAYVQYYFAPVVGLHGTTVTRRGTAEYTPGESDPTMFAAGTPTSSLNGITINGSGNLVQAGNVYSNSKITVSGAGNSIQGYSHADSTYTVSGAGNTGTGPAQWVTSWSNTGAGNSFSPVQVASAPRQFPVTYNPATDFGTYTYNLSSYSLSGAGEAVPAGTYYVTGNVSISGASITLTGVTIVATGTITVSGASIGSASPAAANGVMFYSSSTSANAISVSGASGTWTGLLYAPNGGISFAGAGLTVKNGSLWAQTLTISGAGYSVNPTTGAWGGAGGVTLIE